MATDRVITNQTRILANHSNLEQTVLFGGQVAWVLLVGTVLWGIYGYRNMPQRKDPDVRVTVVA